MARPLTRKDLTLFWVTRPDGTRLTEAEHYGPVPCPECGSPLDIQIATTGEGDESRAVRAAFCTGCEFVHTF